MKQYYGEKTIPDIPASLFPHQTLFEKKASLSVAEQLVTEAVVLHRSYLVHRL